MRAFYLQGIATFLAQFRRNYEADGTRVAGEVCNRHPSNLTS